MPCRGAIGHDFGCLNGMLMLDSSPDINPFYLDCSLTAYDEKKTIWNCKGRALAVFLLVSGVAFTSLSAFLSP